MLSCYAHKSSDDLIYAHNKLKCDLFSRIISLCNNLLPDYHNLYLKCTQWLRHDTAADSGINDQPIKLHSTDS